MEVEGDEGQAGHDEHSSNDASDGQRLTEDDDTDNEGADRAAAVHTAYAARNRDTLD